MSAEPQSCIYKLLTTPEWAAARAVGRFEGSAVDHADGFIHFSTAAQAAETGRRYFSGVADLMVLTVPTAILGDALRWEPSRGGDLFPHLYGPLPLEAVADARPVALAADGAPLLDTLIP
jgi:uncharacterized protein (DUF952 family)